MTRVKITKLTSKKAAILAAIAIIFGIPLAVFAAKPLTQGTFIDSPADSSDALNQNVLDGSTQKSQLHINNNPKNNDNESPAQGTESNHSTVDVTINGTQLDVPANATLHQTIPPTSHNNSSVDVHIETNNSHYTDIDIDSNGWNDSSFEDNDPLRERTEPHR